MLQLEYFKLHQYCENCQIPYLICERFAKSHINEKTTYHIPSATDMGNPM